MKVENVRGTNYVSADEVERDNLPRKKSPVSQSLAKLKVKTEVLERENANLRGIQNKNFNANEFKPRSTKSPITFSYGVNRIAYWKDGKWFDNETDEEVEDKFGEREKTSNADTQEETSNAVTIAGTSSVVKAVDLSPCLVMTYRDLKLNRPVRYPAFTEQAQKMIEDGIEII